MKWKLDRGWLLLLFTFDFQLWKAGMRFCIAKCIVDFAELRRMGARRVGKQRVLRYGDRSWEHRWTLWWERVWSKVVDFALRKL
jgi:hypothetical protein